MRHLRLIAIVALVAAACSASPGGSADDPAGLYRANCAVCHADDGSGASSGPAIGDGIFTAADVEAVVRDGARGMPAYEGRLDADEIAALAAYVSTDLGASDRSGAAPPPSARAPAAAATTTARAVR